MEVDHAGYVFLAPANDYCTRIDFLHTHHKPLIKRPQIFTACHRHSVPIVHQPAVLLYCTDNTDTQTLIQQEVPESKACIWHVSHLILVQGIIHGSTQSGWHHPLVPWLIVSCILVVIIWIIPLPHADVYARLEKQFELQLVLLAANHSRRVSTPVEQ